MSTPQRVTVRSIAETVGGQLEGDGDLELAGVAALPDASPGELSYCASPKHLDEVTASRAGAFILGSELKAPDGRPVIRHSQPVVAWAAAVELFHPPRRRFTTVSEEARIGDGCQLAEDVGIAPGVWIGDRVTVGRGTEIHPGVTLGDDVQVGEGTTLHSGVHVYSGCRIGSQCILHSGVVIGADGYGFTQEQRMNPQEPVRHRKIPQVGSVIVEDHVEIGANSTVDRGALGPTVIGRGTKIDNLVMVAHNCRIGPHSLLIAQCGFSGSVRTGPYVTVAGQAGIAGHLRIGAKAVIGARTGIMSDVGDGEVWLGSPALPGAKARRAYAQIEHLPEFRRRLRELEKRLEALEGESGSGGSGG